MAGAPHERSQRRSFGGSTRSKARWFGGFFALVSRPWSRALAPPFPGRSGHTARARLPPVSERLIAPPSDGLTLRREPGLATSPGEATGGLAANRRPCPALTN